MHLYASVLASKTWGCTLLPIKSRGLTPGPKEDFFLKYTITYIHLYDIQTEEEVERQHQGMDRPAVRQVPEGS